MKCFPFQGIMLHAADNIDYPEEHFKLLLKVFLMFKIRIIYDETIDKKDIIEAVVIMCINCIKKIVRQSKNRRIHHSFFHKYGAPAYWFILDHAVKKYYVFIFEITVLIK